jgi:ketosteroid isomerase-like protein
MNHASTDPMATIDRLLAATNARDVEAIVACFAEDYALESPLHPARSFRGREQVRRNWTQIFSAVGDLRARLVASARDGRTVWTEWEMVGTGRGGAPHCMRGVLIFEVEGDAIARGRMFLEPVDASPLDANEGLREVLAPRPSDASSNEAP